MLKDTCFLVDADGTLWHRNPIIPAIHKLGERIAEVSAIGDSKKISSDIVSLQMLALRSQRYIDAFNWDALVYEHLKSRYDFDEKMITELLEDLNRFFIDESKNVELLPYVERALESIKSFGGQIIVVSNGFRKYIEIPLKFSGLMRFVDAVVTPDVVMSSSYFEPWVPPIKPYRPIYVYSIMQCCGKRYIMVSDSIIDAIGAVRTGIVPSYVIGSKIEDFVNQLEIKNLINIYNQPTITEKDGLIIFSEQLFESRKIVTIDSWKELLDRILEDEKQ